jgi:hypothetical protein
VPDPAPAILGVGIDIEERAALARFGRDALERAAARWLSARERRWCAAQESLADAIAVVLCCKEAVFKARGEAGSSMHEVRLVLHGSPDGGRGWAERSAPAVHVEWSGWGERIVALAVAAEVIGSGTQSPLLGVIHP